jgi:hypothetical protein
MKFTEDGKDALVRILPSCGGTMATMWYLAKLIRDSDSMDLAEILGETLYHPDSKALLEVVETCEKVHGVIDLEGVITHFSSADHLHKFDRVPTVVAAELPEFQRAVAHTLLPLTLVAGKYCYECGDASLPVSGLVQLGPTVGTPYAHLASLIWIRDGGLSAKVLDEQAKSGVAARACELEGLDYGEAPLLREATEAAKKVLGM